MPLDTIRVEPNNTRGWPKNKRQLLWAKARVQDGKSAMQAARSAGYSESFANQRAHKLDKTMAPFLGFLQEKKNTMADARYDANTVRVLREITAIAFSNIQDYVIPVVFCDVAMLIGKPVDKLSNEAALAVKSYTTEIVETDDGQKLDYKYILYNKRSALVDLGRHLGMFNERILLEMKHRHAHVHRIDFSSVPTEDLEKIITTLEEFKGIAKPIELEHQS